MMNRGGQAAAAEAATAEALQITMGINAWEWRWPLGSFVARDASVLSPSALERHARSHAMTQAEYAALLARREHNPQPLHRICRGQSPA